MTAAGRIIAAAALLSSFGPALAQAPEHDATRLYQAGKRAGEAGRYAEAVDDFSAALKLRPDALSYLGRGTALERTGRYDPAIADLTRAIMLQPALTEAYESRAVAEDQKGRYDRAIIDDTAALRLRPRRRPISTAAPPTSTAALIHKPWPTIGRR